MKHYILRSYLCMMRYYNRVAQHDARTQVDVNDRECWKSAARRAAVRAREFRRGQYQSVALAAHHRRVGAGGPHAVHTSAKQAL
eukprot:6205970-Pleurochrysis_carterae.AAC.7